MTNFNAALFDLLVATNEWLKQNPDNPNCGHVRESLDFFRRYPGASGAAVQSRTTEQQTETGAQGGK